MFFCNTSQVTLIKHVLSFLTLQTLTILIEEIPNVLQNDVLFIVVRRLTLFPYDKMLFIIIIISSLLFTAYNLQLL